MKKLLLGVLVCFCFVACNNVPCRKNIDLLPMYGEVKKCKAQIEAENTFLQSCDSTYSSRKEACWDMLRFAWRHHANGDNDAAMKRFNQAWLLDSLNADVYYGFGELLIDKDDFQEAVRFFDKSIKIDPKKYDVYKALGLSYNILFDQTDDKKYLEESIQALKKAIEIKDTDANTYTLLSEVYDRAEQPDSAVKYLNIAEKLDPNLIKREETETQK